MGAGYHQPIQQRSCIACQGTAKPVRAVYARVFELCCSHTDPSALAASFHRPANQTKSLLFPFDISYRCRITPPPMETWKQFEANELTHSAAHHLLAVYEVGL